MPLPTTRDTHIDAALTDFSIAYAQENPGAVEIASTLVRVPKRSNKYFVWDKSDFFRSEMRMRSPGTRAFVADERISTGTYWCEQYAIAGKIADEARSNADINLEQAKVNYLTHQAMLYRSKVMATNCFGTGIWTGVTEQTGVTGSSPSTNQFQFFNESGSKPIQTIHNQLLAVQLSCGRMPNVAVMNSKVLMTLQRHADVTDLFKYTSAGVPSADLVAQAIGVEKIALVDYIENTAVEGATATMARVYGNHILLAYVAPAAALDQPTAITSFSWSEFDQVDASGAAVRSWYDDAERATYYEASMCFDCKITALDAAVFLNGAIS